MLFARCLAAAATKVTTSPSFFSPCTKGISYQRPLVSRRLLPAGRNERRRLLSSNAKKGGSFPKLNERGGVWIYIGWTLLGLVVVDQTLQYKQEQEDNERRRILAQMQLDADNASINAADWDENLPTLFTCKILHVDSGLDGTKMLTRSKNQRGGIRSGINKNIKRGDLVEVIEAGVGPRCVLL